MIDELQKELRSDQEKVIKDLFLHCVVQSHTNYSPKNYQEKFRSRNNLTEINRSAILWGCRYLDAFRQ